MRFDQLAGLTEESLWMMIKRMIINVYVNEYKYSEIIQCRRRVGFEQFLIFLV